jgi:peroxiredoxin Q/BCP
MAPRKKESAEPTRRSTRVVSQSSTTPAKESVKSPKTPKKRNVEKTEEPENKIDVPAKKAKKGLIIGDKLPDLTLKDEEGNDINIIDITFEKGIILFAYPKASTPGCTKQVLPPVSQVNEACGFRDVFDKVSAKEYLIYGISTDAPKANKNFKEKQGLQYHLLSDQKSELLKALGATKEGNKTLRSTWVIGKGGIIEDVQLGSSPGDSVSKSLKKLGIEA